MTHHSGSRAGRVYAVEIVAADLCGVRRPSTRRVVVSIFQGIRAEHPRASAHRLVEIAKAQADLVQVLGYDPLGSEVPPGD